MHGFGEIVVAKKHVNFKSKLKNKGLTCIFIGYQQKHPTGAYLLLNIKTRKFIISQDVNWMNKYYGEFMNIPKGEQQHINLDTNCFDKYFEVDPIDNHGEKELDALCKDNL